ncbi:MAG: GNAT family N-acetyltransferase [Planctomycetaceae bacterium]|nr:GNAT family N-acetyltransferase [Planctomycetaceae bacterium]
MNSQYTIRRATRSDLETLVGFTVDEAMETEGSAPELDAVRIGVKAGLDGTAPVEYWVAQTQEAQVIGAISVVTKWSNFRGGYYWWIQSLYIVPDHRGTGLVDLLLDTVADSAKDAGAIDLRLYVIQSNGRAMAVYRRYGFDVAPYNIMTRSLN